MDKIYHAGLHFVTPQHHSYIAVDDDPPLKSRTYSGGDQDSLTRFESRNPFSINVTLVHPFKEYKYITFLAFPKNASMSFRNCGLFPDPSPHGGEPAPSHCGPDGDWVEHFLICIFRDPVSRFISSFHWELDAGWRPPNRWRLGTRRQAVASPTGAFMEFLRENERGNWVRTATPQIEYLKYANASLNDINVAMTVDNLQEDFNTFCKTYHVQCKGLATGGVSRNKGDYNETIFTFIADNPPILERIKSLYKEDMELYQDVKHRIKERGVCWTKPDLGDKRVGKHPKLVYNVVTKPFV